MIWTIKRSYPFLITAFWKEKSPYPNWTGRAPKNWRERILWSRQNLGTRVFLGMAMKYPFSSLPATSPMGHEKNFHVFHKIIFNPKHFHLYSIAQITSILALSCCGLLIFFFGSIKYSARHLIRINIQIICVI